MLTVVEEKKLEGPLLLRPKKFVDDRGFFVETYQEERWKEAGVLPSFIQDNHSLSRLPGTVRGLHLQHPPFEQAKLVRVIRGKIIDVVVDVRPGSQTFGMWESFELNAEEMQQLYVPAGFLHGFMTLEENTEVLYKVSKPYSKGHEGGVRWDDPLLAIEWPDLPPHLSEKDLLLPSWEAFKGSL
jgi:dTDP-4-dehydrorhamnose 3,5-epimerase